MLRVRCQARVTLDSKGRLALPAKLRRALGKVEVDSLVLTFHEGSIWGYTPDDFENRVEAPLASRDPFDKDVIDFTRALAGSAEDVDLDAAGRIRIPQHLRDLSGISKDAVVISVMHRIEIWDRSRWEAEFSSTVSRVASRSGMPGRREE